MVLKNTGFVCLCNPEEPETRKNFVDRSVETRLRAAGSVLGDGFGTFRDGVFGQFSGEDETDSGLDFSGGESGLLVVAAQFAGFSSDALEDVVDEGVHDGHGSFGDTSVGVDLLQDFVDVGRVGLSAGLAAFATGGTLALSSFSSRFSFSSFSRHDF